MSADDHEICSADNHGVKLLGYWTSFVRRARIGEKRKLAALLVGTYANPDGTSVKCGIARIAADLECGYSTARRLLAWLRQADLLELVRPGNHKAKRADEYRLIVGPAARNLDVPDEADYRSLVEEISAMNRGREKDYRLRSDKASADATDLDAHSAEDSALTLASAEKAICAQSGDHLRSPMGERPPSNNHLPVRAPSTGEPAPRTPGRPPTSSSATSERNSLTDPLTPAQDQQGESLPHASARGPSAPRLADVIPIDSRRTA